MIEEMEEREVLILKNKREEFHIESFGRATNSLNYWQCSFGFEKIPFLVLGSEKTSGDCSFQVTTYSLGDCQRIDHEETFETLLDAIDFAIYKITEMVLNKQLDEIFLKLSCAN